ncbi:hypothetical protein EDD16DRAFT_1260539 [Pisolithus croceorrhizus]|nr:hypothetical protein EDD16DRAFT_1260539 [Pisolithus croceorrhizus]
MLSAEVINKIFRDYTAWGPPSQAASEEVAKLPDIVIKNANVMVSLGSAVPYVVMYSRIQSSRASRLPDTTTLTLTTATPRHNTTPQVILLRLTSSDDTKFPSRMRALTDSVHALGFNAGIYGDAGWLAC